MNTNFNNDPNLNNTQNQTPNNMPNQSDEPIVNQNETNEQTQYQTPYHASNDTQTMVDTIHLKRTHKVIQHMSSGRHSKTLLM